MSSDAEGIRAAKSLVEKFVLEPEQQAKAAQATAQRKVCPMERPHQTIKKLIAREPAGV